MSAEPRWFKSSHSSAETGCCVEVAISARAVLVRDSSDPDAGVLDFEAGEWRVLLQVSARGERPGSLR